MASDSRVAAGMWVRLAALCALASLALGQETIEDAVKRRMETGIEKYGRKDYDGALHEFEKAIALDAGHAPAYYRCGLVRHAKQEYEQAAKDYTKALEVDPEYMPALYSRGVLRQYFKDHAGAIDDFTKIIELPREKLTTWYITNAHLKRGDSRRELVDYAGAVEDYGYALYYTPKSAAVYLSRAKVHEAMGNWDGAVADYTSVLEEIDAKHIPSLVARARAREALGEQAAADADFGAAIFVNAEDPSIYMSRARVRMMRKDYEGAVADCDKAEELSPKWYYPYFTRALIHYNFGEYRRARVDLLKGAKRAEVEPDYLQLYALLVSYRLKRGERGVQELKEYVAQKKEKPGAWYGAIVSFLCKETDEAAFLAAAEGDTPKQTREQQCEAFFYAGQMRLLAGDEEGAHDLFRKCVATGVSDYIEYETSKIELAR